MNVLSQEKISDSIVLFVVRQFLKWRFFFIKMSLLVAKLKTNKEYWLDIFG
jgi:hypothetical protein